MSITTLVFQFSPNAISNLSIRTCNNMKSNQPLWADTGTVQRPKWTENRRHSNWRTELTPPTGRLPIGRKIRWRSATEKDRNRKSAKRTYRLVGGPAQAKDRRHNQGQKQGKLGELIGKNKLWSSEPGTQVTYVWDGLQQYRRCAHRGLRGGDEFWTAARSRTSPETPSMIKYTEEPTCPSRAATAEAMTRNVRLPLLSHAPVDSDTMGRKRTLWSAESLAVSWWLHFTCAYAAAALTGTCAVWCKDSGRWRPATAKSSAVGVPSKHGK